MKRLVLLCLGLLISITAMGQAPKPGPDEAREKDRTAIRETMASFVDAFKARDAEKLAAHWTDEGEHQTAAGVTLRGRDSLQRAFAEFFSATPEVEADIQPESLRFLSAGSAIGHGVVTVRKGIGGTPGRAHYETLLVREGDTWKLAILKETSDEAVSVKDLEWLIGNWKSTTGSGADIETTYVWDANKKFIHSQFAVKEEKRSLSGRQVIGVDPATGSLHSWTFEANGGVGEADWTRDGDHWVLDAAGTLPDGRSLTETNIIRRVNADTFTWQSTNRLVNDGEVDDLAPVKVTRVPAEKK